ncbi:MAG: PAS domain S-box protein [Sulfuricurvum sp.]|jgi:PAS domain S-box-containing protein|uniref:PAS domain S-box protein n=1 Tax=Sulfuricurvum sp. TaxID=2025608 RepID=UPI0026011DA1|nr:PAS domain S-box protein [Sulfuricurvum sp.]MCK9373269.1 PAS domain S-box protein [Sulfuricurvum sp.]
MTQTIDILKKELETTQRALAESTKDRLLREAEVNRLTEELLKTRHQIEYAEQEWIAALDVVEDLIFIHDKDFRILRCNRAYQHYASLPFKHIIGQPYFEIFPKTHLPLPQCLNSIENEIRGDEDLIEVNGTDFRSRSYPIHNESGEYLYSVHILEDITERKNFISALRESEEKFRSITTTAQDAILMMDDAGKITYWNHAAETLFGYSEEEATGQLLHTLIAPERFHAAHDHAFVHFKKTGQGAAVGKTLELTALRRGGDEFPIELSLSSVMKNGHWNAIGIIRDISERKNAEILIQRERDFSERLIATAPVIILILDPRGRIVRFNHYMETLSGYSLHEVEGEDWFNTFLPEPDREKTRALFLEAIDDIQTQGNVNTLITKQKEERQIEWYDKTLKDEEGGTIGLIAIGTDVTERIAAQEVLKLFRTLLDHSSDAIEVLDPLTLRFVDVNETACRALGYTREELLSMSVRAIDPAITESQLQQLDHEVKTEGAVLFETRHRRKDGSEFPVEISMSLVQNAHEYRVAIVRDITERKNAEQSLNRANQALKTLSAGNLALVRATDEDELLKTVTKVIVQEGGYALAVVDYANEDLQKSITPMAWAGFEEEQYWIEHLSWGDNEEGQMPVGKAIRSAKVQLCRNIAHESESTRWREAALAHGYLSSIALPLSHAGKTFGALNIYSSENKAFDEEEVRLLEELSNDLAYGIITLRTRVEHENHSIILQQSLEQSIQTIAATVEARDPYTAGHQRRVSELATAIAVEMGLPKEQVNGIHLASIIHDLGKIQIPSEILSKPGKLNTIEFMLIQTHPQAGYDILKEVTFPWPIARMILQHHEKLDGSGYPQGLVADQILLEAKIITVSDVVEAMSSHRPYRPALGINAALEEIKRGRGIVYDPSVVDACLHLFNEKGFRFSS